MTRSAFILLLAAVTLLSAGVRFARLDAPPKMYFDEIYYAKAAQQILSGVEVTEERTHPPLSKLIIACGVRIAGDGPTGWRTAGAAAGTLLPLLVGALGLLLFQSRLIAAGAALLASLDGLLFVESRIAKPDVFLTLFLLAAYASLWSYLRGVGAGGRAGSGAKGVGWLYLAGAAAGCAVATKWTALIPLSVVPLTLLVPRLRCGLAVSRAGLWHAAAALTVVPAAVYMLAYVPYFQLGHSLREFASHHAFMFRFHATLTEGHPYQSRWWSWPLLLRPIWYEYAEVAPGTVSGVLAVGNPVIWWAGLVALVPAAVGALRRSASECGRGAETFLVVGFLLSYVQYAFIGRVLFLYHYMPALPFLIIGLSAGVARLRDRAGAGVVAALLLLAAAWFAAFYPILAAVPVAPSRVFRLMWFGTWI